MAEHPLNRTLFISDNLPILRGIDSDSVDLIATDPPFNKGVKDFEGIVSAGMDMEGQKVSYSDVWTWGDVQTEWTNQILGNHPALYSVIQAANMGGGDDMGAYLCWLAVRVLEMHRILKPTGSMYLHIDHTAHAYAKCMLDAIFGRRNFRNGIVWKRTSGHSDAKRFGRVHDVILYYTASEHATWNPTYQPYEPNYIERYYRYKDSDGRLWMSDNLSASGLQGGGYEYEWKGITRVWRLPESTMARLDSEGRVFYTKNGIPRRKRYLDEQKGLKAQDNWTDIQALRSWHDERTGYPTQKPLALYERIIKASSNEGDLVLDPFAGCATTCVAAERLNRKWIGIDINEPAEQVVKERLQREVNANMKWNELVKSPSKPPIRTDDGEPVAPELVLVRRGRTKPRIPMSELRDNLLTRDGQRCQGCGWQPPYPDYLEVDHKKPRSLGGDDYLDNRTLLCSPCNRLKSNKLTLTELRHERVSEGRIEADWWEDERWR